MIFMREKINLTKAEKEAEGVYCVHVVDREKDINFVYFGSGHLASRISGNKSKLRRNCHDNPILQQAYNKFQNCYVETIATLCPDKETARKIEKEHIEYFKLLDGVIVCNDDSRIYVEKDFKQILTPDQVKEIRILLDEERLTQKEIGQRYGVGAAQISKIKTGRAHAGVK